MVELRVNDTDEVLHSDSFPYVALALSVCIMIANGIVILSAILFATANPGHFKASYMLLANLATTDAFTAFTLFVVEVYSFEAERTYTSCLIVLACLVSMSFGSAFFIVLMGFDRYICIVHAHKYSELVTSFRVKVVSALTWVVALVIGFLPVMGWTSGYKDVSKYCSYCLLAAKECVITSVILGNIIPVITLIFLYTFIFIHMKEYLKRKQTLVIRKKETLKVTQDANSKEDVKRKRTLISLLLFVASYCLTTLPFFIGAITSVIVTDEDLRKMILYVTDTKLSVLGFANSLLNPLLYAYWHRGFRRGVITTISKTLTSNRRSRYSNTNN